MAIHEAHNSYAVLGLSVFGLETAVSLFQAGADVVVVDHDQSIIQHVAPDVTKAVCGNLLDWDTLESAGVFEADVAIIGLRKAFDATVLMINHFKSKTSLKKIVALVDSNEKAEVLKTLGVDEIIFPEHDSAKRLVTRLTIPNLVEHISLTPETTLIEMDCPGEFIGQSLVDLKIRSRYQIYIIGIIRRKEPEKVPDVMIAPPPDTRFEENDRLICLGNTEKMAAFSVSFADEYDT